MGFDLEPFLDDLAFSDLTLRRIPALRAAAAELDRVVVIPRMPAELDILTAGLGVARAAPDTRAAGARDGLRLQSEGIPLTWDDADLDRARRHIKACDAKSGHERWLPLGEGMVAHLRTMRATSTSPYLFAAKRGGPLTHFKHAYFRAVAGQGWRGPPRRSQPPAHVGPRGSRRRPATSCYFKPWADGARSRWSNATRTPGRSGGPRRFGSG